MSNKIDNQASIILSNESLIFNLKENLQNNCNKIKVFTTLEESQRNFEEKIKTLTIENLNLKSLLESNKTDLNQINDTLTNFKLNEKNDLEVHYKKAIENANEEKKKIEAEKLNLERDLNDAKTQITLLKEQIRPIGYLKINFINIFFKYL